MIMKNKKKVNMVILVLILVLTGVTVIYYKSKSVSLNKNNEIAQSYKEKDEGAKQVVKPILSKSSNPTVRSVLSYDEISDILDRDEMTFLVLGREGCTYCEKYKPILESVSKEYSIDIVYVDIANMEKEDYDRFMNSRLTIPAKCNKYEIEVEISKGFGTPLTLFVKKSETKDCLRGYKEQKNLVSYLKNNNYILKEN